MPQTHTLKTWPQFFRPIVAHLKTFEIRVNDRDYQVGDTLILQEFDPCGECGGTGKGPQSHGPVQCRVCAGEGGSYTGDEVTRTVTYTTTFLQQEDQIVMAIS